MQPALLLVAFLIVGVGDASAKVRANPPAELNKLAETYKIDIVTANPAFPVRCVYGTIDGKAATEDEIARYSGLFTQEFALYPRDLVKRCNLKRIVLCKELAFAGERRGAIPDYQHDVLYLDVVRGDYDKHYVRKVIHHEFFHIIDYKDDGIVYEDERWASLNPTIFKYGAGGRSAQGQASSSLFTDKYPGFLNHYSTTGVEEDKAEVFAALIVDAAHVEARVKKDVVLRSKVARMKELTASFCPDANVVFWERASKTERPSKPSENRTEAKRTRRSPSSDELLVPK